MKPTLIRQISVEALPSPGHRRVRLPTLDTFTEVIEIQGEKPPKPVAPPPTAQTP